MGILVDEALLSQKVAAVLSMALSLIAMIVSYTYWAQGNDNSEGWLGTIYGNKCVIHAVLMITAFCFTYTQAAVSYRVLPLIGLGHEPSKFIHSFWNTSTMILMITALVEIARFHNEKEWGHLTTMHSWLGVFLVALYSQNWVFGFIHFVLPVSVEWRKRYLPSHRFFGIVGLLVAAIVMETGIAQKNWLDDATGCFYTNPDSTAYKEDPATAYFRIDAGCRAALGIGTLFIFNAIFAVYALWDFRPVEPKEKPADPAAAGEPGNVETAKYVELVPENMVPLENKA